MEIPASSQTVHVGSGVIDVPPKFPTLSRRPPPLTIHKKPSRQSYSSAKGISHLVLITPRKSVRFEDGDMGRASDYFSGGLHPKPRRQSTSGVYGS